jgi:hypothetical protein
MRILMVLGLVLVTSTAQAQSNDNEDPANQFIQILKAAQQKESTPAPARQTVQATATKSGVTTIQPDLITATPMGVTPQQADQVPMNKVGTQPSTPSFPGAGDFQAAEPGKMKVRLTPKTPAFLYRAYLTYEYPNSVRMSDADNHVMFSKYNMPGGLRYSVKLEKDKKYLIEIEAQPEGGSGGHVQLHMGGDASTHELGAYNEITNISRVVTPQATGWVHGLLIQGGGDLAAYWRVYAVEITELE